MQAWKRQRTAFSSRWDLPGEHDEGVKEDCEGTVTVAEHRIRAGRRRKHRHKEVKDS